jgi:hypothetical protein
MTRYEEMNTMPRPNKVLLKAVAALMFTLLVAPFSFPAERARIDLNGQ